MSYICTRHAHIHLFSRLQVFYHLDDLDDAVHYALGAGTLFDIRESSDYVRSILSRCIDTYISVRTSSPDAESASGETVDRRLVAVIERLFDRCLADRQLQQAVGVALESRHLNWLRSAIRFSNETSELLEYTLKAAERLITPRIFRDQVLRVVVEEYQKLSEPDYASICGCLTTLEDADEISRIIVRLLKGSQDDILLAYQLGFDLFEAEVQSLRAAVRSKVAMEAPTVEHQDRKDEAESEDKEDQNQQEEVEMAPENHVFKRFDSIVSGETPIELERQFLARCNASDLQILKNIKAGVEPRNSVCHGATVFANSIMHCGTTIDTFLRENLDWLAKSTNWSKFSATAGLGVIHKGNLQNSRSILSPYLPSEPGNSSGSQYSEAGALYALGLVHVNHGAGIRQFLLDSLRGTQSEVVQHGACLGLGIAGLGSEDEEVFEEVKNVLYQDSAIAGEAAGMVLGLVFAGTGTERAEEMLAYAHDTQHEKIIRGLALGLAIISYRQEEAAEALIEAMTLDQDSILRYGGMFVIGLAYCGTSRNAAIQKLLHFAVSDVSDDVRRAATACIGFVLAGDPTQCPRIVGLLAESYNPHVRYGAALAIGIAAAGTGSREALNLLEPMLKDSVDFVQQGALIASALVLVEQSEARQKFLRERIASLHSNRGAEIMARMGAIMAAGILDAGGRNATLSLRSESGYFRRTAVVGLAMFLQYWYWYPLSYCISMALHPTALIGVDATLGAPEDFRARCNCKPSLFAYPVPVAVEDRKTAEKMPTAVLSTTARAKARAAKKAKEKKLNVDGDGMDVEEKEEDEEKKKKRAKESQSGSTSEQKEEGEKKDEASQEASFYFLENPARVVASQRRFVSFLANERWHPVRPTPSGFVVLRDSHPEEPVKYLFHEEKKQGDEKIGDGEAEKKDAEGAEGKGIASDGADNEPAPPAPFEYIPS